MKKRLFGTDGVRGHANSYPMTVENAVALGRAVGKIFCKRKGDIPPRVVIGKDTRLSCYMFENAIISGLLAMGVNTLMVGPLPTPGVAFITRAYRADAGIVISASHNGFQDNGIKFFSADGFKLPDIMEEQMEALIEKYDFDDALPPDHRLGKNTKIDDAAGRYIEFCKATLPRRLTLKKLNIVLDCAHGAAYRVAPLIFQELDAHVNVYCNNPNGTNINDQCGALYPEVIQKGVIDHKAHVGIALDGDADRVIMVDENAQIVDGDTLLAICAYDLKQKGLLHNNCVVSTVMSNFGFIKTMERFGIKVEQSAVGDRYVIQKMLQHGSNLGGEQSGHIIFLDHNTTGDGLLTALQVMRIMIESDTKLSELAAMVERYPQALLNIPVAQKPPVEDITGLKETIKTIESKLKDTGRVLVRYSGTENICRILVEGPNHKEIHNYAQEIADVVDKNIGLSMV